MGAITERFISLYKSMNLTGASLERECGGVITRQKISHIENGRYEVSIDIISTFVKCFPNVSAEWLITGTGEKFKDNAETKDKAEIDSAMKVLHDSNRELQAVQIDYLVEATKNLVYAMEKQEKEIKYLSKKIDTLLEEVAHKDVKHDAQSA